MRGPAKPGPVFYLPSPRGGQAERGGRFRQDRRALFDRNALVVVAGKVVGTGPVGAL